MQTESVTLLERVEALIQASREPLSATASTSTAIAELLTRIEALEAALREIADDAGARSSLGEESSGGKDEAISVSMRQQQDARASVSEAASASP